MLTVEVERFWWASWTSNPVYRPKKPVGGFDSHALPPVRRGWSFQPKEVNMFTPGPWELIIILLIVLVIFGAGKLPEIGSGLGKGIKNFKKAVAGKDEIDVTSSSGGEPQPPKKEDH